MWKSYDNVGKGVADVLIYPNVPMKTDSCLRLLSTGSVFIKSHPFSANLTGGRPFTSLWTVIGLNSTEKTDGVCYPWERFYGKWRSSVKFAENGRLLTKTDPVGSTLYPVRKIMRINFNISYILYLIWIFRFSTSSKTMQYHTEWCKQPAKTNSVICSVI